MTQSINFHGSTLLAFNFLPPIDFHLLKDKKKIEILLTSYKAEMPTLNNHLDKKLV